jgi:hypothetical protein
MKWVKNLDSKEFFCTLSRKVQIAFEKIGNYDIYTVYFDSETAGKHVEPITKDPVLDKRNFFKAVFDGKEFHYGKKSIKFSIGI